MDNHPILAVDTETTGPYLYHGCQPFAVSACDNEGNLYYWDFAVDPVTREVTYDKETVGEIVNTFLSYGEFVMHNAVFDIRALELIDWELQHILNNCKVHDTLLMSHIVDTSGSHGLKDLAYLWLEFPASDEKELKNICKQAQALCRKRYPQWEIASKGHHTLPNHRGEYAYCDYWLPALVAHIEEYEPNHRWFGICQDYAEKDVERTILLYRAFKEYLERNDLMQVYEDHLKVREPVQSIQASGIHFHKTKARIVAADLEKEILPFQEAITKQMGDEFNPRSSKQLREYIYDKCLIPVTAKTAKGSPSTDAETLHKIYDTYKDSKAKEFRNATNLISNLIHIRKRQTTINYIKNYLAYSKRYITEYDNGEHIVTHYLHPSLNQTGTSTTRFSCNNPNGQNISKGTDTEDASGHRKRVFNLRELFGPPPGYEWYAIDYKSLQLIIFAYEAGDDGLIDTFLSGGDPHNYVACTLFGTDSPSELQRRVAKNVNYALIFGAGERKIDLTAGMPGAYKLYKDQFPIVSKYMDKVVREARHDGYVKTAWGYPITTPAEFAYRGVNYIIQGDEGEIVKRAMVKCHQHLRDYYPECELILQVHDELIFEAPIGGTFPLKEICDLMMEPAKEIGWHTPVDACLVKEHWGSKEDLVVC